MIVPMEVLLVGVVGQLVALRLLVLQLARSPDDPPLVRKRTYAALELDRRRRRHGRLLAAAIIGFVGASAVTAVGLVVVFAA